MKILVVEDERLLARRLIEMLKDLRPQYNVLANFGSVKETIHWLQQNQSPDLIFMDIELADGQCFTIFEEIKVSAPVIFTTAFEEYALQAFRVNSVDYLLKPIMPEDLDAALEKFEARSSPAVPAHYLALIAELRRSNEGSIKRKRFLVSERGRMVSVENTAVAFFTSRNNLNYVRLHEGSEYYLEYSLDQIQAMIDENDFFRANRQFILSHRSIKQVFAWFNGKLKVELAGAPDLEVIISREKALHFKRWMGA